MVFSACPVMESLQDVARKVLSKKVLAYYSSASDDEISTYYFPTSAMQMNILHIWPNSIPGE